MHYQKRMNRNASSRLDHATAVEVGHENHFLFSILPVLLSSRDNSGTQDPSENRSEKRESIGHDTTAPVAREMFRGGSEASSMIEQDLEANPSAGCRTSTIDAPRGQLKSKLVVHSSIVTRQKLCSLHIQESTDTVPTSECEACQH